MDVIDFYNAISSGDLEKIRRFQEENNGKLPLNRNVSCACGKTFTLPLPLITALEYRQFEVARYFIACGADPDLMCRLRGKTPRELMPEELNVKDPSDAEGNHVPEFAEWKI